MYIAIAGNIGSGKTTLTEMLTERYGAKAYYEQSDNPYIGDFYNDMNRWSFNLQMYFLGSRIQQTMDILRSGPVDIFQDRNDVWTLVPFLKQMKENDCRHVYDKDLRAFNVGCMLSYMDYTPRTLEEIMTEAGECFYAR